MTSTHTATLNIPTLPPAAGKAHIFPSLTSGSLLSIGQLCDFGCTVNFTNTDMTVYNKEKTKILIGHRDESTGMWRVPLPIPTVIAPPKKLALANGIIKRDTPVSDLCQFLHAACFSPTTRTFIDAIRKGFFTTWPGLSVKAIQKYLPQSESTTQGHLDQEKQGTMSTQISTRTNNISASIMHITSKIYTDLTGRFPIQSNRGNNYLYVLYDYDSNAILAEPMKNRGDAEMIRAYTKLHTYLCSRGLQPKFQILDNEASQAIQDVMTSNNIDFQLAPPHMHRRNAAERAIRTFKNHFIAGLSSVDPNFPLQLWDRLIPQAVLTLNLLRASRLNPRLSAEMQLNGPFNYMKTPLAPPGTKCQIHIKPDKRASFGPHSIDAWYVGPAPKHYRCYTCYIPSTGGERVSDTVEFFPTRVRMPQSSALDKATQAAEDLIEVLKNPEPASPFLQFGNEQSAALQQLADMFKVSLSDTQTQPSNTPSTAPAPLPRVEGHAVPRVVTQHRPQEITPPPTPAPTDNPITQDVPTPVIPQTYTGTRYDAPPQPHRYNTRSQARRQQRQNAFHAQLLANPVINPSTGASQEYHQLIKGPDKDVWQTAFANEIGRLAKGVGTRMPSGTETLRFIAYDKVPKSKRATYARIVSEIRPQKPDPYRVRITVGGNLIDYPGDKSQPTADLTTAKLLLNSVISTPDARFMTIDIKNMYLQSEMKDPEYMRIPLNLIPDEIIDQYNLHDIAHNGFIYCEIQKGMYGLPQAGKLAHDKLKLHLAKYGYAPCPLTTGLWKHNTRPITFALVVDDFGVKYVGREHAIHLIESLQDLYELHLDWSGKLYIGITLDWDYINGTVDLSMPNYVEKALHKFQHNPTHKQEHSPHKWNPPTYGQKIQYAEEPDDQPLLSAKEKTRIQQIVGTFLYYARVVDCTMLAAINDIASEQSAPTQATAEKLVQFLNYAATHPDAIVRFTKSQMTLYVHSDASYLSAPKARSRVGGHFYLSNKPVDPNKAPVTMPPNNGAVHTECKTMRVVVASATEAEMGGLFHCGQAAVPLRNALIEMGHPQPPTPIQTDNATASGIVNSSIRQRKSKAMDMRFYWVQDRCNQNQFIVYWKPGKVNLGDYFSKHHPAYHHLNMRKVYLHQAKCAIQILQKMNSESKDVTGFSQSQANNCFSQSFSHNCSPQSHVQGCKTPELSPQAPELSSTCGDNLNHRFRPSKSQNSSLIY
jgi:hypothetical protein